MLTLLLYALLAVLVIAALFLLAVFVLPKGEQIAPPSPDTRPWEALPERHLQAEDVVAARLPVALRGYRFAETDLLLDRLTDELRQRDHEIARLRGARPAPDGLPAHPEDTPEAPESQSWQGLQPAEPAPQPPWQDAQPAELAPQPPWQDAQPAEPTPHE